MVIAGLVLAAVAALIHVFIFYLESIAWTGERARAVFGSTPEEAEATRELAFNQGFYNLFLALSVAIGIVFYAAGSPVVAVTLALVGTASMASAALVLFITSPDKRGAALKQGIVPMLAVIALVIGLAV